MFDRAHFARFIGADNFDIKTAIGHFQEYLKWRKTQNIDKLLVRKFILYYERLFYNICLGVRV